MTKPILKQLDIEYQWILVMATEEIRTLKCQI